MSNISLEQIDLIMQRTHTSYAEAKAALEHCNGDVIEALLYLEKKDQVNATQKTSSSDTFKNFINTLNATTFIMKKKDRVYINVPLSVALIAIILCFHISILGIIVALCMGVRMSIQGENDLADQINSTFDKFKK